MNRNPKWQRDEIVLALNLYFLPDRGPIDAKNPKIVELSKVLNSLPLVSDKPNAEKFRNPNGVALKLSNFAAIDPNYPGKGMTRGSKLDEQIFNEYVNKKDKLRSVAVEILRINHNTDLRREILTIEEDEQTQNDMVEEGNIIYKLHKLRERSPKIVEKKKKVALSTHGKLVCEVCSFDFRQFYGKLGEGFIECHHRTPLSSLKVATKTRMDDLSLVCSNCHRMLHRHINTISIEDLKEKIVYETVRTRKRHQLP